MWLNLDNFLSAENRLISIKEKISLSLTKLNKYSETIRPLAYMNEIGEAFRPIVSVYFVRFLYGISWSYIFTDTAMKVNNVKNESNVVIKFTFFDFQMFWPSIIYKALKMQCY